MSVSHSDRADVAVVIGTYNRLGLLQRVFESVGASLGGNAEVHITDAGSTDGTVAYLESIRSPHVIPYLVGERIGQAQALNRVFTGLHTRYVCWISDDNILLPGALDVARDILSSDHRIGMVALKVKDVVGPFADAPYIGGISPTGILNVNQGMLPTQLLQLLGGFNEEFRDYGIDPDLTARVLFSGHRIVYTRQICIHHHRQWPVEQDPDGRRHQEEKQARWKQLYEAKYAHLLPASRGYRWKLRLWQKLEPRLLVAIREGRDPMARQRHRDWMNIFRGRYISMLDSFWSRSRAYHLVQSTPRRITRQVS